jgi:hypothetical protein
MWKTPLISDLNNYNYFASYNFNDSILKCIPTTQHLNEQVLMGNIKHLNQSASALSWNINGLTYIKIYKCLNARGLHVKWW